MLVYRPPSLDALMCRREFYTNSKVSTESTTEWFERVANLVNGCQFENFADIMLIDKFLSGLDEAVYRHILKEISLDSHQALLAALTSESSQTSSKGGDADSKVLLKTEDKVEDQDNDSNWFDNDEYQWASGDDDAVPMKTEFINLPMVDDVTELDTPITTRPVLGTKKNEETGIKKSYQKRNDFVINDEQRIVCLKCFKSYATRKSFRRHYTIHTETCFPCPKCEKVFTSIPLLRVHMSSHDLDNIRNVECYICRLTFREISGLRVHMGKEHRMDSNGQSRYDTYMRTQNLTAPRSHVCEYCGKDFHIKAHWRRHLLTHTNERNHTCEQCGKSYTRKDRLHQHMLIHTGECPHTCKFCSKKFRLLVNAKRHERTHTGEKPYKCDHPSCDKTFAQIGGYRRHQQMHAQIKPCACHLCEKKFATNYHLQRHMSVHTGQKPYCCELCGNRFTQLCSLKLHKSAVHKQTKKKSE